MLPRSVLPIEEAYSPNQQLIDVRTPQEFQQGALVGAVNIPLFNDEERSQIGLIYKQVSKEEAMQLGHGIVTSRLDQFAAQFNPYRDKYLTIYCARGGMRSASVASFLQDLGFRSRQLQGGYKAYRQWVGQEIERLCPHAFIEIHGQTGVGKTRLIEQLPNSLNLEGLAQHRSSLFGGINLKPRPQKSFEAYLHQALANLSCDEIPFVEGESIKIGSVCIPKTIFQRMRQGVKVLVTAPLEIRVQRIIQDYVLEDEETLKQLEKAILNLKMPLGLAKVQMLLSWLNRGQFEDLVQMLMLDYYDPRYLHAMRQYQYALEISAEDLEQACLYLQEFRRQTNLNSVIPPQFAEYHIDGLIPQI